MRQATISDSSLIDRIDVTWQALEQLGEHTKQTIEEATVAE
jgi:hypothetical protein